jgi:hypothetical protein
LTLRMNVVLYVILSAIGAVLLTIVALFSEAGDITVNDKMIVGGAFIASCVFGISLALRPGWTKGPWRVHGHITSKDSVHGKGMEWVGHHPDCDSFRSHVLSFGKRTLCSGCTGLGLGAVMGIVLTLPYILLPVRTSVPSDILLGLYFGGLALVAVGFADIAFSLGGSNLHGDFNLLLILGFLFVVVAVHQLSGSVAFGLISVLVCFLWLDTRIQLSRWRHVETCRKCSKACKAY